MPNAIRDVTFRPVEATGDDPGGQALFLTLELGEPTQLWGFLEEVVSRFKRERVAGPDDTRFMLVTIYGEVTAPEFVSLWQRATAEDPVATALLGMLHRADVLHGESPERMIGQASLLAPAGPVDAVTRRDSSMASPITNRLDT
ncbi:MAG TPA: hypothetical protein VGC42_27035 [Kofleriaceae bacterium]